MIINQLSIEEAAITRMITMLWLILLLATGTIATAWFFELGLGYIPCKLCLQQRWAYYVAIPLTVVILTVFARGAPAKLGKIGLILLAIIFIFSAALGIFHAGIEWGLWQGPTDCGGNIAKTPAKVGDLLNAINGSQVVSCTHAAWRLLGISMAGWNAVISALMAGLAIFGVRKASFHGSSSVSQ